MAFNAETFSRTMKVKRAERGWSQQDLAKASGISIGMIARYESETNAPSFENVCKIAEAFRCSVDDFRKPRRPFATSRRR